jgi:hypothetical protein
MREKKENKKRWKKKKPVILLWRCPCFIVMTMSLFYCYDDVPVLLFRKLRPSEKMTVFWDVASSSVVKIHRRFRGAYCLLHQGWRK